MPCIYALIDVLSTSTVVAPMVPISSTSAVIEIYLDWDRGHNKYSNVLGAREKRLLNKTISQFYHAHVPL